MKILFLNLYSGKVERGAESFAHELANRLSRNHSVTFNKGDSSFLPKNKFSGSIIGQLRKRLFLDRAALEVLFFTLKQISHIGNSNYDVITPLNGFWQVLILKLLQPFKHFKIIITGHSGPGWDERWNLYLKPNYFVSTTKPTLEWAKKTCPWTDSVLIPYGIDPKKFKSKPAKLNLKPPIILCPSALVPYKRVDLAIKAVAKLKSTSLLVLGKGPLKNELNSLGKKLLGKRFLIDAVPYSQMPSYYATASVITLPSDPQENSPMVFLESLAAGKTVVVTDAPRTRWALGQAGSYTNPQDIDQYAKALKYALTHKPKHTYSELEKFSWPKVVAAYHKLFLN